MAHVDDTGGKGGRSANVDVNIIPFIDLMCVMVIFLLISAVWTQVSMIQIGSSIYGKKTSDEDVPPPPRAEIPFRVDIRPAGHQILIGRQSLSIPKKSGAYDLERLLDELKKVKQIYPEKVDVVVTMNDELEYLLLVEGMDALLQAGFPQISISTAAGVD